MRFLWLASVAVAQESGNPNEWDPLFDWNIVNSNDFLHRFKFAQKKFLAKKNFPAQKKFFSEKQSLVKKIFGPKFFLG